MPQERSATPAPRTGLVGALGAVPGAVLGATFGAVAKVRRTKPLHPVGRVGDATLVVTDPRPRLGVPLLAAEGTHRCFARWSRAAGLPSPLPDVEGLALRLEEPRADLLFASTGTGSVGRYLLTPRGPRSHGTQTTLLPVASAAGPLLFAVTPAGDGEPPRRYTLSVACGSREWETVGRVEVDRWRDDEPTRFDPVTHMLPGTEQYPVVRLLREPSYLLARKAASPRT